MRHVCVFFVRVNDAREWRERSSLPKLPIVYVCVCVCLCMFVYLVCLQYTDALLAERDSLARRVAELEKGSGASWFWCSSTPAYGATV
jgi:hypothetical protein